MAARSRRWAAYWRSNAVLAATLPQYAVRSLRSLAKVGGIPVARLGRDALGERLHVGRGHGRRDLLLQPVDHGLRRALRRPQPGEVDQAEVLDAGFGEGRHVGQRGEPLVAADGQQARLAALDVAHHARASTRPGSRSFRDSMPIVASPAPLKGTCMKFTPAAMPSASLDEVRRGARAAGAVGDLARLGLGGGDQVAERLVLRVGLDDDAHRREHEGADRHQVLLRSRTAAS